MKLPDEYVRRMQLILGEELSAYLSAMEQPPVKGLRVNTLKLGVESFLKEAPWALRPIYEMPEGYIVAGDTAHIGRHPLHRAGLFYMQEPYAMRAAARLGAKPGMRLLDLCAAPGGKAGQLAACLQGKGLLIANEVDWKRANILNGNLERLGVRNALVTCMRPEELCSMLEEYFDAVMVDAPCSGEGMFRKEPQAILEWSIAHVGACAARQGKILDCAAMAVKPGGMLAYATCTFSKEENEDTVEAFCKRRPMFQLAWEERLYPHTGQGEGQYIALLRKKEGNEKPYRPYRKSTLPKEAMAAWDRFAKDCFSIPPEGEPLLLEDGRIVLLPIGVMEGLLSLRLLRAGVQAGEYRKGRVIPAHGLALAYPAECFQRHITLDDGRLGAYLHGDTIEAQVGNGYMAVCYKGFPIGWGKAAGGIIKNHLPKGLRE